MEPGHSWFQRGDDGQHRDHRRDLGAAAVGWQVLRLDERFRRDLSIAARHVAAAHRQRQLELAG
ncbi:MAG: hypothetical protein AAFP84_11500 [Actinomycetota bacterium]